MRLGHVCHSLLALSLLVIPPGCSTRQASDAETRTEALSLEPSEDPKERAKEDRVLSIGREEGVWTDSASDRRRGSDPFADGGRGRLGRPAGLADIEIAAVSLKGVVISHTGSSAIVDAPCDGCSTLYVGDQLKDGYVKAIMENRVVFAKKSEDPTNPDATVEVVKTLGPFRE